MEEDKKNRFIIFEDEEKKEAEEEKIDDNEFFDDFYEPTPEEEVIEETYVEEEENSFEASQNLQNMINKILRIDSLDPVMVDIQRPKTKEEIEREEIEKLKQEEIRKRKELQGEIDDIVNAKIVDVSFKSDLLDKIRMTGNPSILARYGDDLTARNYITNPSIGRDEEIKQLILTLLTPEKSAILIGKPGIGKTSIVEGLAFRIQRDVVPDGLKGYSIVNIKTASLIGVTETGETRLQTMVDELKKLEKVILFIDEIHMLIGATNDSAMDFANMFKEGLGRGQIKVIGATTTDEYERYILRDKAFVRRFQTIDVQEPTREHTIKIMMGTLPKIEKETGTKFKYTSFIQSEIMAFIVDITSEFKRIYGIGSRYPDICLTLLKQAFSHAIFQNRKEINIFDVRNAILNSTNIYPDVIKKEIVRFDEEFKKIIEEENQNFYYKN